MADFSPVAIARDVIANDLDFLERPGGRAGDDTANKTYVGPYQGDPYSSQFIERDVLGVSTKTREFDRIFREVSSEATIRSLDGESLEYLRELTKLYTETHPDIVNDRRIKKLAYLVHILQEQES